jgi:hypothetical protein
MRNAQLRDALEPLLDESIGRVNVERMTTGAENEFLQSMLEWERAPMLPICEWFQPKLELPHPDDLTDDQLRDRLYQTIGRMFEKHIVLDFTDHLTDRQLYCLIYRDILPSHEKMIRRENNYLHDGDGSRRRAGSCRRWMIRLIGGICLGRRFSSRQWAVGDMQ